MAELIDAILKENAAEVSELCSKLVAEKTHFVLDKIDEEERLTPLCLACKLNNKSIVDVLLSYGANPNVSTTIRNRNKAPLHFACEIPHSDVGIVSKLLSHGADVNIETSEFQTPLQMACSVSNINIAKVLIASGADLNIADNTGRSPLIEACYNTNYELLVLLVENGGEINNSDGMLIRHPLSTIIEKKWIDGLKYMLQKNVDFTKEDFITKVILGFDDEDGEMEMLDILLKEKIDVNYRSSIFGFSPIHHACVYPNVPVLLLKKLIENGADVNIRCKAQNTPLHHACQNIDLGKIKMLLCSGSDPNAMNVRDITPIEATFRSAGNPQDLHTCLELFSAFGAKFTLKIVDTFNKYRDLYSTEERMEIERHIKAYCSSPLPLTQLCRIAVRKLADVNDQTALMGLAEYLPSALIKFLTFEDGRF